MEDGIMTLIYRENPRNNEAIRLFVPL